MSSDEIELPALLAASSQFILLIAGVIALWRCVLSPRGRAAMRQPSPLGRWAIPLPDFGLAILVVIAGGVGGQIAASLLFKSLNIESDLSMVAIGFGFQGGLLAGAAIAAITVLKPNLQPLDEHEPVRPVPPPPSSTSIWISGPVSLLAGLPVLVAVNLGWTSLLEFLQWDTSQQPLVNLFADSDSSLTLFGMAFLAVVVAPITEEVIFRAGLYRYLRERTPRWVALGPPRLYSDPCTAISLPSCRC